jgi:hypothetical protein
MSRPLAAARYLALTSGRSALGRALPLYLAIGVASVVLFGGNGLDARTVTAEAERSRSFRCVLLAAWWLAALPVGRAWIGEPAALSLRALPVPRVLVLALLALGCLAIQLPWAAFALVMGQLLHLALGARAGLAAACAGGGSLWALASLYSVRRTTRGGAERAGQLIVLCVGLALVSLASLSALLPR